MGVTRSVQVITASQGVVGQLSPNREFQQPRREGPWQLGSVNALSGAPAPPHSHNRRRHARRSTDPGQHPTQCLMAGDLGQVKPSQVGVGEVRAEKAGRLLVAVVEVFLSLEGDGEVRLCFHRGRWWSVILMVKGGH